MKHTGYQRFFQKADILNSWDAFLRRMSRKPYRRRDDCPKWVKADAIEKAQQKREMRAKKRLEEST